MLDLELLRDDTLLIGLETLNRLQSVFWCQIFGSCRRVGDEEPAEHADNDGDKTEEEIDNLVNVELAVRDTSETVANGRAEDGSETVCTVPAGNSKRLLRSAVEGDGNDGEEGNSGSFEPTE